MALSWYNKKKKKSIKMYAEGKNMIFWQQSIEWTITCFFCVARKSYENTLFGEEETVVSWMHVVAEHLLNHKFTFHKHFS
jgi:hypothetical protein